jgi:hypothetical protein
LLSYGSVENDEPNVQHFYAWMVWGTQVIVPPFYYMLPVVFVVRFMFNHYLG